MRSIYSGKRYISTSMPHNNTPLNIVFIGAGNLATHLAGALHAAGHVIRQVYSRTLESARLLADAVGASPVCRLEEVVTDASLYIVSLKDDAFLSLLPQLVQDREQALWVHTAGSIPMLVWEGHGLQHYGVFYPMQTFSKQRAVNFREIPVFLESHTEEDAATLHQLARSISDKVYKADSAQRKSLHLAAVFCCNFTNHMYALSAELLQRYGLPFDAMLPLIDETARKVHELSPREAQTGPAVRYDRNVINSHLDMLKAYPEWQQLYESISENIHQLSITPKI